MSENSDLPDAPQGGSDGRAGRAFPIMYCRVTASSDNTLTELFDETQGTISSVMHLLNHMACELGDGGSQLSANTDDASAMLWMCYRQLDLLHNLIDNFIAGGIQGQAHEQALAENERRMAA